MRGDFSKIATSKANRRETEGSYSKRSTAPWAASGFQAANNLNRFVVSSLMPFSRSDGGTVRLGHGYS